MYRVKPPFLPFTDPLPMFSLQIPSPMAGVKGAPKRKKDKEVSKKGSNI